MRFRSTSRRSKGRRSRCRAGEKGHKVMFDYLIEGGLIIDGSGRKPFSGDVGSSETGSKGSADSKAHRQETSFERQGSRSHRASSTSIRTTTSTSSTRTR